MTAQVESPSPRAVAAPVSSGRAVRSANALLALLVVVFAFLVSSFAARNTEVWQHLGTGRLLARGEYHFGQDPFAYTTQGIYWANHAWLFDLLIYTGYQALGGTGLIVLKAIAVVVLAG